MHLNRMTSVVVLRLRPDLARENRGPVHHIIQNTVKDFITSTVPNYVSQEDGAENARLVQRLW